MSLHPWWSKFGQTAGAADRLRSARALSFASVAERGDIPGVRLVELKQDKTRDAVYVEIDVERPQELAFPIKAVEPIGFIFPLNDSLPGILALREDFPDTPHQNWTPEDAPCSLCVDDRPWAEAKLTSTPADLLRRARQWLAKAACGELHDPAQPLDPLFFRSWLSLVIPSSVFAAPDGKPVELVGFMRPENPNLVLTSHVSEASEANAQHARFLVLPYTAAAQGMARFRHAPRTLQALHAELERGGVDLLDGLKNLLLDWAGQRENDLRRLNSRLIILVVFPIQNGVAKSANDRRAFVTSNTAGEIAVALGVLLKHPTQVGGRDTYYPAIRAGKQSAGDQIEVQPAEVHLTLDRDLAANIAGHPPDRRKAVLVGAGSLGSQLAVCLAREGALSWTIVDQDCLLPHNLARHALFAGDVGVPKALALARQIGWLLGEQVPAAPCDAMNFPSDGGQALLDNFTEAEVIIDASASVAVSRYLSDFPTASGRRVCTFFNPAGTAVVVMVENGDRSITLRDLEAQYHNLLFSEPKLAEHLKSDQPGLRYSGSCRAVTNRIAATHAAALSAIASRAIGDCLTGDQASIRIWTMTADGEVQLCRRVGSAVTHAQLGLWTVTYDDGIVQFLRDLRARELPNETGGVLLGIVDVSRHSIHLAHALPAPEDSFFSVQGFERGVVGLVDVVAQRIEASLHQLRYVGEWHSHPAGTAVWPSQVDVEQLAWLAGELETEGLPALMAIVGDDDSFSVALLDKTCNGEMPDRHRRTA